MICTSVSDEEFCSHRKLITDWEDFISALKSKNICVISIV